MGASKQAQPAAEPSSPLASAPKIDKAKLWEQLLELGHLPLASLKDCSPQPGDQRTLFSHLSRVLGEMGGGVERAQAKKQRPQAGYTLDFSCDIHQPKAHLLNCKITANDLNSREDLHFGLQFDVALASQRIQAKSIACDYI